MFTAEKLSVKGGDMPSGDTLTFDIPVTPKQLKLAHLKIVQKTLGAMDIVFEVWETSDIEPTDRETLYMMPLRRHIVLAAGDGGQYSEILAGGPIVYTDRDAEAETAGSHNIHCRLENRGTTSDFDVSLKIAEIAEVSA